MYCRKCGKELTGKEKFCPQCGNSIQEKLQRNAGKERIKKCTAKVAAQQKQKSIKKLGVILTISAVIAAGSIGTMYFCLKNSGKNNKDLDSMQDAISKGNNMEDFDDKEKEALDTKAANSEKSNANLFEISLTNVSIGNSISLGNYQQSVQGEKEEIRWKVIDIKDDKALLLSEKILFGQPYNETNADVTWEQCTLRKYLNNEFIKEAFNETESALIQESQIVNMDNNSDETDGGNDTLDKVFCLSSYEVNTYFAGDSERICECTQYALSQVAGNGRAGSWWLRSPGRKQNYAATVTTSGETRIPVSLGYGKIGDVVSDDSIGVRPAMWIKVKSNSEDADDNNSLPGGDSAASDNISGTTDSQSVSLYERLVEDLSETSCYLVIGTDELEREDALRKAEEARASGFPAHAIRLHGEYYVSLGGYDLQDKADEVLWYAIENGYPDSRIEYTGRAVVYSEISKID